MLALPNISDLTLLSAHARKADLRLKSAVAERDTLAARLVGVSADADVMAPPTGAEVLLTHSDAPPAGWASGGVAHALRATRAHWAMSFPGGGPPCGRFGSSAAASDAAPPYDTQSGVGMTDPGGELSAAAWVRFTAAPAAPFPDVMDTREPGVRNWRLRVTPASLSFQFRNDAGAASNRDAALSVALDTWYLLGFAWESDAVSIWIDGVRRARDAGAGAADRPAVFAAGFNAQRFDVGDFDGGFVAAAAVWRRALAADEWAALYAAASPSGGLGGLDHRAFVSLSRPVVRDSLDAGAQAPAIGTALRPAGASTRCPAATDPILLPGILKRAAAAPMSCSIFVRPDRLDTLDLDLDVRLPSSDAQTPIGASPVLWRRTLSWVSIAGVQVLDTAADGHLIHGRRIEGCRLTAAAFQILFDALPQSARYAGVEVLFVRVNAQGAIASNTHRYQLSVGVRNTGLHYLEWTGAGVALFFREVTAAPSDWRMVVVDGSYANYDEPNAVWKTRGGEVTLLEHGDQSVGPAQSLAFVLGAAGGALSVNLALGSPRIGVFSPARFEWRGSAVELDDYFVDSDPGIRIYDGDPRLVYETGEDGSGVRVREVCASSNGTLCIETAGRLPTADEAGLAVLVVAGDEYWAARLDQRTGDIQPEYSGRFLRGDYAGLRAALVRDPAVVVRLVRADAAGVDTATWEWAAGGERHSFRWRLRGASPGAGLAGDFVDLSMPVHDDGGWHQAGLVIDGDGVRGMLDGAQAAMHSGRLSGSIWAPAAPVGATAAVARRVLAGRTFGGTVLETVRGNLYQSNDQVGFLGADGSRVYLHRLLVSYTAVPGSGGADYRVVVLVSSTAGGHYTAASDAACAGLIFVIRARRGADTGILQFTLDTAGNRNSGGDRAFVAEADVTGIFDGAGQPDSFDLAVVRPGRGFDPSALTVSEAGDHLFALDWTRQGVAAIPDARLVGSGAALADEAAGWGRALSAAEFADAWLLRGVERLFGGFLDGPQRSWPMGEHQLEVALDAVGYARDLGDRRIEGRLRIPTGMPLADAAAKVMAFESVAGGTQGVLSDGSRATFPSLPLADARVSAAASGKAVGPVVFDYQTPGEAFDWLADQTETVWRVDQYGAPVFRLASEIASVAVLSGAADVSAAGVSVDSDEAHLRTRQIVIGGRSAVQTVRHVSFDGAGASGVVDASDARWVASASGYIRWVLRGTTTVGGGRIRFGSFPPRAMVGRDTTSITGVTLTSSEGLGGDILTAGITGSPAGWTWPARYRIVIFRLSGGRVAAVRSFLPADAITSHHSFTRQALQVYWFVNDAAALRRDLPTGTSFVIGVIDEQGPGYTPAYLVRIAGSSTPQPQAPDGSRRVWDLGSDAVELIWVHTRRPATAAIALEGGSEYAGGNEKWEFDAGAGTLTQADTETVLGTADGLDVSYVSQPRLIASLTSPSVRLYRRLLTDVEQDAGLLAMDEVEARCRALLSSNDHVSLSMALPLAPGHGTDILPAQGVRVSDVADVDPRIVWLVRSVDLAINADSGGRTTLQARLALRADDTPYDLTRAGLFQGRVTETPRERARHLGRLVLPSSG